jgi:hypothetical protein
MSKYISVGYFFSNSMVDVQLTYTTQVQGNVHTIVCSVDGNRIPFWLQLRKFEMLSLHEKNVYVPLFNEVNNGKNMDTVLFIDTAYNNIMLAEHLKVKVFAEDAA